MSQDIYAQVAAATKNSTTKRKVGKMREMMLPYGNPKRANIKVGDEITFKAITRYSSRTLTRKVVGINAMGQILVVAHGYRDFVVNQEEIHKINGEEV